ncbi:MAG: YgcG family protein [Pseudomonadota bacterium]
MTMTWGRYFLLVLLLCGTAQAEVAVPKLTQRVTDLTATLDTSQIQALDTRLAAFEAAKGAQVVVLILPTTQPEGIEQFAIRVADVWKLGRKGVDDGVLLLVAKDDRKLRIEVGYGLEGALTDAAAKRIVAEIISPAFKRGEFYAGIDAGVSAILGVVEGEPLPQPTQRSAQGGSAETDSFSQMLGIGFVIFMLGNILLRQLFGRLSSGLLVGAAIGVLVWFTLLSLAWAAVAGLAVFVLSLFFGAGGGSSSSLSPMGWGGGGNGNWGGGSSGGFGGGGASGDW